MTLREMAINAPTFLTICFRWFMDSVPAMLTATFRINGQDVTYSRANAAMGEKKIDDFVSSATNKFPIPTPLNINGFLRPLGADKELAGFFSSSTVDISAESPYYRGFEGVYSETAGANTVSDITVATEANPMWFSRYYTGPRTLRGGLVNGWGGIVDGHILKVYKPVTAASEYENYVGMLSAQAVKRTAVRVRGYVYIEKGIKYFSIGGIREQGATVTVPSLKTWHYFDVVASGSNVTAPTFGINMLDSAEQEMVFALLSVTAFDNGTDSSATLINNEDV